MEPERPASGTRVEVAYSPAAARKNDARELVEYMTGRFQAESKTILEMNRQAAGNPDKQLLYRIGARSLAFRQEIGFYAALAKRLWAEEYADKLETTREVADRRPTGTEVQASAKRDISWLGQIVDTLTFMQDQMQRLSFWAQAQTRDMSFEEMSGEAAGSTDVDESFYYEAPLSVPSEYR